VGTTRRELKVLPGRRGVELSPEKGMGATGITKTGLAHFRRVYPNPREDKQGRRLRGGDRLKTKGGPLMEASSKED